MAHDLQLDLDVLVPDAHGPSDRCVADLVGVMEATSGVTKVHLVPSTDGAPARLCLHVEPGQVSVRQLSDRAQAAGAAISSRYGHIVWPVRGVGYASRAETASALLRRLPGVLDASVGIGGPARIEFDRAKTDPATLRAAAAAAGVGLEPPGVGETAAGSGYGPESEPSAEQAGHDHDHPGDGGHAHGGASELIVAAAAFAVYLVARILDWTTSADLAVTWMYVAVAVVTGVQVGRDVLGTLRARRFDIEVLMFAAAAGAAAIGQWSDAALLLVLFSLGHGLEGYAMGRARREIEGLADLAPPTARRRDAAGEVEEVAVEALAAGDVLVIRPNDRIAADGVVVSGTSSVDEAPVTGESVPVDKAPVDASLGDLPFESVPRMNRVFAGTLNGPQVLEVRVARTASDSTLARVVKMVAEAETQVSPTQVLTERIVRIFVPAVLALVGLLLVAPLAFGQPFEPTFLRAMAVLVAASPCALAIATPSAVLAAVARSARAGVLVKGGGPLEDLGRVSSVAFDKTGTLTEGRPRLVAVVPAEGVRERELLAAAIAVERLSDHPLARAITTDAAARVPDLEALSAEDVQAVVGKGVRGVVQGVPVGVGNAALFDGSVPAEVIRSKDRVERDGATTMIVARGDQFLGILGVMDTPRPEAGASVQALLGLGVDRVVMLSGDQQAVAFAVAAEVGVPEVRGGLLPEDKVAAIRELAATGGVAMVGDGVNDAPALASATVGIAMGAAGSDIALETADIALMADRLDRLPFTVALARRSSRVIRQNLFFSLGVVAVLIPLTIFGVGIGPAVIAHEGSTLVVVANALGLLAFRDVALAAEDGEGAQVSDGAVP